MARFWERLRTPVDELDRAALETWSRTQAATPLSDLPLRTPVVVVGEVRSVRIVPRAGADGLEVTISDGVGQVTAVFLGRRRIPGIGPGRRLELQGVATAESGSVLIYNPRYRLFPERPASA